jgi:D-glycero-D-manno-heptose 1,7-bisphosphate phosphatase
MRRAVFLDRDGVINEKAPEGDYVTSWEEMRILPGVSRAIMLFNEAGFCVIVVSNQRCVAKGLITVSDLAALHRRLCQVLSNAGATVDAIYFCPHEVVPACSCRKPRPGMLFEAAYRHNIDLTASWIIGDSDIDIEAGKRAGCMTARLGLGKNVATTQSDIVAQSLLEAADIILGRDFTADRPTALSGP